MLDFGNVGNRGEKIYSNGISFSGEKSALEE